MGKMIFFYFTATILILQTGTRTKWYFKTIEGDTNGRKTSMEDDLIGRKTSMEDDLNES